MVIWTKYIPLHSVLLKFSRLIVCGDLALDWLGAVHTDSDSQSPNVQHHQQRAGGEEWLDLLFSRSDIQ